MCFQCSYEAHAAALWKLGLKAASRKGKGLRKRKACARTRLYAAASPHPTTHLSKLMLAVMALRWIHGPGGKPLDHGFGELLLRNSKCHCGRKPRQLKEHHYGL